jgi:alcohol dehydrogenase class IV
MGCQHHDPYQDSTANGAESFTVAMPRLSFGRGVLDELGERAAWRGFTRVALFTDPHLLSGPLVARATQSLKSAGIDFAVFSEIRVEPDDDSVMRGAAFLSEEHFDGLVSVGGGSVIDAAKGAAVVAAHGGGIVDYFAPPAGGGRGVPGPVLTHIACPTTAGTGSECTSITVIRINELDCKFVVASPWLLPVDALVDPSCLDSLPNHALASTGFDLCCHALECWTARPYVQHASIADPRARQLIQGSNPFSDLVAREAMEIVDRYLVRGVNDAGDHEARDKLMWGASLAGIAFGNSGTHLPHAMSYGITHLMKDITTTGYPVPSPFVPHGISVIVNAPSIFRFTASGAPERHLEGAAFLGADSKGATPDDAGEVLANRLVELMRATGMPNGLNALGFSSDQLGDLTASSMRQGRAIANAPRESNAVDMANMYSGAMSYW